MCVVKSPFSIFSGSDLGNYECEWGLVRAYMDAYAFRRAGSR